MIVASVVLPRPGGPYRRMWSAASPLPFAPPQQHGEVGLDLALADVFVERARPEGAFDDEVHLVSRVPPTGCARGRPPYQRSLARTAHIARMFYMDGWRPGKYHHATRVSALGCCHAAVPSLRIRPPRADRPRPARAATGRSRWPRSPSATSSRPSSSSRSWPRSSGAGIVRTTLGAHGGYAIAADPSAVSLGRVIRLLDGALAPLGCVSASATTSRARARTRRPARCAT